MRSIGWTLAATLSTVSFVTAQELRPGEFEKLRTLIRPTPAESRWAEIPWQTSLWEARKKAAAEGKPLFLWSMDGNPCGSS